MKTIVGCAALLIALPSAALAQKMKAMNMQVSWACTSTSSPQVPCQPYTETINLIPDGRVIILSSQPLCAGESAKNRVGFKMMMGKRASGTLPCRNKDGAFTIRYTTQSSFSGSTFSYSVSGTMAMKATGVALPLSGKVSGASRIKIGTTGCTGASTTSMQLRMPTGQSGGATHKWRVASCQASGGLGGI